MNKTKIEWCDMTWNPVTGCLNNCEYCYARKIAKHFTKGLFYEANRNVEGSKIFEADEKCYQEYSGERYYRPYPFSFDPTLHRYRLDEPQKTKKPQNIFVCSMADLFGGWVPETWIKAVFEACEKAPQHRYLFLTKNPKRYEKILSYVNDGNMWLGATITKQEGMEKEPFSWIKSYALRDERQKIFYSIEPMQEEIFIQDILPHWVIIGAETGNRKEKVIPEKKWIRTIKEVCDYYKIPLFMKNSLAGIWGKELIRQYPWEVEK